ncbi:MAG: hypothetical protein JWQ28_878 [Pedobacter sp.]|nr:hypothetical protein [Pedobacter sp.]
MQHIQDKDIDQLFKDRFEDAEIQPSAGLWNNIQKEIRPKQQKKLPVLWMAAASVAVIISVTLLFNTTEKIQMQGKATMVSNAKPAAPKPTHETRTSITSADAGLMLEKASKAPVEPRAGVTSRKQVLKKEEKTLLAMQPISIKSHQIDITHEINGSENRLPVTEDLPTVQVTVAGTSNAKAISMAEEALAVEEEPEEAEQSSRSRIRNATDLVNFVVDKLDKREQKILEFRTDEDDNTSLVAINIGPLKLNTRKHK